MKNVKNKTAFKIEIPTPARGGSEIYHVLHVYDKIYAVIHHVRYYPGYDECIETGHSAKFYTEGKLVDFLKKLGVPPDVIDEITKRR